MGKVVSERILGTYFDTTTPSLNSQRLKVWSDLPRSSMGNFCNQGVLKRFIETNCTLSEQIAHSTVDLHLKEISEFLHGSALVMNKNKSYTRVSRSTYTHKVQPLYIRPIELIASESTTNATLI